MKKASTKKVTKNISNDFRPTEVSLAISALAAVSLVLFALLALR